MSYWWQYSPCSVALCLPLKSYLGPSCFWLSHLHSHWGAMTICTWTRSGQEKSSGQVGYLHCWPFGSGPAAKCFLAGKATNDVPGDKSLLWLWCQRLSNRCDPWAECCKKANDFHTVCTQNKFYPQTERTLVMFTRKINSSLEYHADPGCEHKLVHIYMQGMSCIYMQGTLWSLPICSRRAQEKSCKEESLYNIHHQLFKATVCIRFLSHWHSQVRWEHSIIKLKSIMRCMALK